jgi:hypothetical protein
VVFIKALRLKRLLYTQKGKNQTGKEAVIKGKYSRFYFGLFSAVL